MQGSRAAQFQSTSWTLVLAARLNPGPESHQALATLCQIYWQPIYAFIRRTGYDPEQAQDLTQGFFVLLLEKNYLRDVDRELGRFRSFLLVLVKHFLANEWHKEHALKRGGGQARVSFDLVQAEDWYAPQAVDSTTPQSLFERRWALSMLEQTMSKLRANFTASGKVGHYDRLSVFLNGDPVESRYEALAAEMGITAGALRVAIYRMRRKFRDLLRAEIAETVSTPEQIDAEIGFLLSTLSQ